MVPKQTVSGNELPNDGYVSRELAVSLTVYLPLSRKVPLRASHCRSHWLMRSIVESSVKLEKRACLYLLVHHFIK